MFAVFVSCSSFLFHGRMSQFIFPANIDLIYGQDISLNWLNLWIKNLAKTWKISVKKKHRIIIWTKKWLKRDKTEKNVSFLFSWNCSVKNRISMNSLVFNEGEYYSKMKSARMIHVTFIYSGQVLKSFHARLHAVNCLAHCTLKLIIHSYLHNIISTWLHFAVHIRCES